MSGPACDLCHGNEESTKPVTRIGSGILGWVCPQCLFECYSAAKTYARQEGAPSVPAWARNAKVDPA